MTNPNLHITEFLNYYCDLPTAPQYAVMLKGKWGSGKTHFINEYNVSPGKWLQNKRLQKAKETLEQGTLKPTDIYLDFKATNLCAKYSCKSES